MVAENPLEIRLWLVCQSLTDRLLMPIGCVFQVPNLGHSTTTATITWHSYCPYHIILLYRWSGHTTFAVSHEEKISLQVKMRPPHYSAVRWPITATLSRRLDAAHCGWRRNIPGIWGNKNEDVRARIGQQCTENIVSERRLCWFGLIWTDLDQQQGLHWEVLDFKRGPGRTRTNWRGVVKKDLQRMGLTWKEAEVAALNRQEWCRTVAQCVHMDASWI